MPGTYDPKLDTVYWTTSNAAPDFVGDSRPGDDLYTACVLALNPDTGALKWYFQFTPHDLYDYDANETPVLVDVEENGTTRHLLVQANRNGFLYVLDRSNGKFVRASPFVQKLNWATVIGPSGGPLLSGRVPTAQGTYICPGINGATNWFSPSYNPDTGLFYVNAHHHFMVSYLTLDDQNENKASDHQGGANTTLWSQSMLLALDYETGKIRWSHELGPGGSGAGVLTTDSGLTFSGDAMGNFLAVDSSNGKTLWHAGSGSQIHSSPISYELDGRQYVVTSSGGVLFAWALADGGK